MTKRNIRGTCLVLVLVMLLCRFCGGTQESTQYDVLQISRVSFVTVAQDGTITEVESLAQEALASFCEDFAKLRCYRYGNDPIDYVIGSAIRITFLDGSYHLINNYCTIYHEEGKSRDTRQCYRVEDFTAFWNKYCDHEYKLPS